jgi:hypothetical protein
MPFQHCCHIKEDGFFCQAPALRERSYCRFHLRALGAGLVEDKRARLMLYGLRQAAINLRAIKAAPRLAVPEGQEGEGIRAEECPGFEEEFGLPPDIDLSKPPEVVFPAAAATPTGAQQAEPSAYRSNPWQEITAEDIELQEILATQGQEAYEKRSLQLQAQHWKQIDRERPKLDEAHRLVAAARRDGREFTSAKQKAFYEKLQADDAAQQKATIEEIAAMRAAMAAEAARKSPASASGEDETTAATGSEADRKPPGTAASPAAETASAPPPKSGTE